MTISTSVERVVAFLNAAAFRELPAPLIIRQTRFEFAAAMIGPGDASDIILIVDTVNAKDADTVRKIQGVARALDLARSRNPLTTVLVGPKPNPDHLTKLMQVCRVLPVGTVPADESESHQHLSNWLAVLTPLDHIDTSGVIADPMATLMLAIDGLSPDVQAICGQAPRGAGAVEDAVNELLKLKLDGAWEDEV